MGSEPYGVNDFPAGLLGRVDRVRLLAVGGEAVVFLVEPVGSWCPEATEVVVKVNKASRVEFDQLRLLSLPNTARHVPRIFDYGNTVMRGVTVGWVAQEYCRYGSLDDVIHGNAPPAGEAELRRIITELADCLNFWTGDLGLTHTDVKPANVLVRSREPYELLIGDFGGTARGVRDEETGIQMATTVRYAAPETMHGRRGAPAAWWALGIIAYELLLHRTPYAGMTADEVVETLRAGRRATLTDVGDPHWRQLIEGLLNVEPERRWDYEQVTAWTARKSPPLRFNGRTYWNIEHLTDDLGLNWEPGIGWLAANGDMVADWLVALGADTGEVRYLRGLSPGHAPRALARLTAHILPEVTPRYAGRPIDAPGLLKLAQRGEAEQQLLRKVLEDGVLQYAAEHHCAHPGCRERCVALDGVRVEVPEIVERVEVKLGWLHDQVVRSYRKHGPAELPSEREWTLLWAWATEMTLWPAAAVRARASAAEVPAGVPWWPGQRRIAEAADPATVPGRADLVAMLLLAGHARRAAAQ